MDRDAALGRAAALSLITPENSTPGEAQAASARVDAISRRWGLSETEVANAVRALEQARGPRLRRPFRQPAPSFAHAGGTVTGYGAQSGVFVRVTVY